MKPEPNLSTVYDKALNAVDISHPAVSSPTAPPFHHSLPVQQPDPKREQVRVEVAMKVRESLLQKVQQTRAEQSMDEDDRRTRYQKKIDLLERHLECCNAELERDPGYGHVFATSGYRVDVTPVDGFAHGCTIDWGLIDVDQSRRAVNEVCRSLIAALKSYTDK